MAHSHCTGLGLGSGMMRLNIRVYAFNCTYYTGTGNATGTNRCIPISRSRSRAVCMSRKAGIWGPWPMNAAWMSVIFTKWLVCVSERSFTKKMRDVFLCKQLSDIFVWTNTNFSLVLWLQFERFLRLGFRNRCKICKCRSKFTWH